jgi:SAM-dependent methyltransferase
MKSKSSYDSSYFSRIQQQALDSAAEILPVLLRFSEASSVVDVGCGEGAWLQVASRLGVKEVHGIDGDYVQAERLLISKSMFQAADLTRPISVGRRFDLAVCLEVAEHLPPQSAAPLVASLVSLAPAILFSAAIPGQGGINHLNERWPSYWQSLFGAHGYKAVDCIRPLVWANPRVAWWYAQNAIIYAADSWLEQFPTLVPDAGPLRSLIHPGLLEWKLQYLRPPHEMSIRELLRCLPRAALRGLGCGSGDHV